MSEGGRVHHIKAFGTLRPNVDNSTPDQRAAIARLEAEAAKLLAQLNGGLAKRVLIIEFSGLSEGRQDKNHQRA